MFKHIGESFCFTFSLEMSCLELSLQLQIGQAMLYVLFLGLHHHSEDPFFFFFSPIPEGWKQEYCEPREQHVQKPMVEERLLRQSSEMQRIVS